ncbi:signal recognition particle-docking protein FtsY [Chelatococcus asaccharovorans]|uniref:Signal recognition particle receptor FtsY n=1 Tax=Chelatococcus asaccharovorans TaxID=28210 RepID=A0A2V3U6A7_9HYPH|nr:signal recognition particle-docking protein FtsY [Chelatococcus asaccharovorans]MBS7705744.1 signal recognition particle-docking protein FtsY [Chelatococcus asaccharovorans]PXW58763.1 signal recognition particle-docking protein FtsY [Chelatococcus asaccharovorans]
MAENEKRTMLERLFGRRKDQTGPNVADVPPAPQADDSPLSPIVQPPAVADTPPAGAAEPRPVAETDDTPPAPFLPDAPRETAPEAAAPESMEPEPEPAPAAPVPAPGKPASWWQRLTAGLKRTSSSIGTGITDLFTKRKFDAATLEELEDILIQADLGVAMAARVTEAIGKGRHDRAIDPDEVKGVLAREIEAVLVPVAKPLVVAADKKPFVILMVGVNGSGKTTTIGKLAAKYRAEGRSVMLAAGDTFRAAAVEQLKVWGTRTGATVVARDQGADAAGLAFDALQSARDTGTDVLIVDTAGRLQNKAGLMAELEKIVRVMRKMDAEAPHAVLLVLDATTGQNALNQAEIFGKTAGVTGLVMTKLDGTARGGILVALADKTGLPVHFIGVGEGVEDLEPFTARDFARAIAGLDA